MVPLWRNLDFLKLWAGQASSQFGEQITVFCIPLMAALTLGATPADMGLLGAAATLPYLLLTLPIGVLTDRLPRRTILLWSELGRGLLLMVIPIAWATGLLSLPLLLIVTFGCTVWTIVFDVAHRSSSGHRGS